MALGSGLISKIRNHGCMHIEFFSCLHISAQHQQSMEARLGVLNLAALAPVVLLYVSVWAPLSGVIGKCYLGNFKDCLTATLDCVKVLWKCSHAAVRDVSAEWGSAPARCTRKLCQKAWCWGLGLIFEPVTKKSTYLRKYVLWVLVFNRQGYPLKELGSMRRV